MYIALMKEDVFHRNSSDYYVLAFSFDSMEVFDSVS